ncbi:hypothetical protein L1987_19780 [Smallanthus sonchifolius]|uniref:Uncharacterized protein n=1 Tax=Smallanthus sonchifolius TaxID=185202 RepID=A0ACB9IS31_9ASTR|nr:hypothetical protein L1987_19780 [Smallanthus sonchifolius]
MRFRVRDLDGVNYVLRVWDDESDLGTYTLPESLPELESLESKLLSLVNFCDLFLCERLPLLPTFGGHGRFL